MHRFSNTQKGNHHAKILAIISIFATNGHFHCFLFWTLDKIIYPKHAAGVFSKFYGLESMGDNIFLAIGIVQLIIILSFAAGLFKTWTYGLVLLLHTVSTVSTFSLYTRPFDNLLFFAAWPMLAACIALFLLRDWDTFSLDKKGLPAHIEAVTDNHK